MQDAGSVNEANTKKFKKRMPAVTTAPSVTEKAKSTQNSSPFSYY